MTPPVSPDPDLPCGQHDPLPPGSPQAVPEVVVDKDQVAAAHLANVVEAAKQPPVKLLGAELLPTQGGETAPARKSLFFLKKK